MEMKGNEQNPLPSQPDCTAIAESDCRHRLFPPALGPREGPFSVVMRQSALNAVYRQAHATPQVEVCGVMVGNICHDGDRPFLMIEAVIEGLHADGHAARVTFTSDTWSHFHEVIEQKHPDSRIVGWYHTHPGFGIFLSGMDLFIHRNFFDLPWQTAFVYDPLGGDEGMFIWQDGKAVRARILVHSDEISSKPRIENPVRCPPPEDEMDSETPLPGESSIKRLRNWLGFGK